MGGVGESRVIFWACECKMSIRYCLSSDRAQSKDPGIRSLVFGFFFFFFFSLQHTVSCWGIPARSSN